MLTVEQIRTNSARLRKLNERIEVTARSRSRSPAEREEWERACAEFHSRFDELFFPGGSAVYEQVRHRDPEAVEAAVRFLEADPRHFRSGYAKEHLWRVLAGQP